MEQDELLRFAVEALNSLGLRFLVTGSIATVIYGEPRFTNDIDLVVGGRPAPSSRCSPFLGACLATAPCED
jgi:hypothetical protein